MKSIRLYFIILTFSVPFIGGCKKFVEVGSPKSELIKATVFTNDATAKAALAGMYAQIGEFATGGGSSISLLSELSADDLVSNNPTALSYLFNTHDLLSTTSTISTLWAEPYKNIYRANAILEGLEGSVVSKPLREQFKGEALFFRAFANFYLLNQFGDIPLILTTDYQSNALASRVASKEVYQQIISDLKEAQSLLINDYSYSNGEKTRVNQWVATAFLSRVYLYNKDFINAEVEASKVINNSALFVLDPLQNVFLKNSKEAIWQLSSDNNNTQDAKSYVIPTNAAPTGPTLTEDLFGTFETKDERKTKWIASNTFNNKKYYYPIKYKAYGVTPITEYSMVLRLSEQYLIRAEARINQAGKIPDGISDLNIIRVRASLPAPNNLIPLLSNLSKDEAMQALENEKRHELFCEWGHRWFDLKRWQSRINPGDPSLSRSDDILKNKLNWRKEAKLYPIPETQIVNAPNMVNQQNPGY